MKQHARFSPSKLGCLEICSKYKRVEDDSSQNEFAAEGILMHKAYETGDFSHLDEEQREQVEKVIAYTESLFPAAQEPAIPYVVQSEISVSVSDLTYGFIDKVITIEDRVAHVLDAKFGRLGAEEAGTNLQVACYCCGKLEADPNLEECHGHIVSPRINEVSEVVYTRADIPKIHDRIRAVIDKADDPWYPPVRNPDLCTKCARAAKCPAMNEALVSASPELSGLPANLPDLRKPVDSMDSTELCKTMALCQILEAAVEAKKKQVVEVVRAGKPIEFYGLISKKGSQKIENARLAFNILLDNGVGQEEILDAASLSLSKLSENMDREKLEKMLAPVLKRGPDVTYLQRKRGYDERKLLTQ